MVIAANVPKDANALTSWLLEQAARLQNADEVEAMRAALGIMELAFEGRAHPVPGLIQGLLGRLSGSPPMSHAAAWALCGINRAPSNKAWQPSEGEIASMLVFVSEPSADPYATLYIVWILGVEKVERGIEPLTLLLENPLAEVRARVANTLGRIGSMAAVRPLLRLVDDPDAETRAAAVNALGGLGARAGLKPLIWRLNDNDARVRRAAAFALARVPDEEAVAPLTARLQDSDMDVRRAALWTLARQLKDEDRRLLSIEVDGYPPFLDPRDPISKARVEAAASALDLSVEEVRV
jgi:HEAT repeat protein